MGRRRGVCPRFKGCCGGGRERTSRSSSDCSPPITARRTAPGRMSLERLWWVPRFCCLHAKRKGTRQSLVANILESSPQLLHRRPVKAVAGEEWPEAFHHALEHRVVGLVHGMRIGRQQLAPTAVALVEFAVELRAIRENTRDDEPAGLLHLVGRTLPVVRLALFPVNWWTRCCPCSQAEVPAESTERPLHASIGPGR